MKGYRKSSRRGLDVGKGVFKFGEASLTGFRQFLAAPDFQDVLLIHCNIVNFGVCGPQQIKFPDPVNPSVLCKD